MSQDSMPTAPAVKESDGVGRFVLVAVMHLFIGTLGVTMATAFAWFGAQEAVHFFVPAYTYRVASQVLLEIPGYPLHWLQGVYVGFVMAKLLGPFSIRFVWVLPLLLHCIVWAVYPSSRSSFFEHYVFPGSSSPPCLLNDGRFVKAETTLLLICSVAYALGGLLRQHINREPIAARKC